jgi:hypothetical protein
MSIQLWRVLTPTISGFFSFLVLPSLCGFCSRVPVAFKFVSKLASFAECVACGFLTGAQYIVQCLVGLYVLSGTDEVSRKFLYLGMLIVIEL